MHETDPLDVRTPWGFTPREAIEALRSVRAAREAEEALTTWDAAGTDPCRIGGCDGRTRRRWGNDARFDEEGARQGRPIRRKDRALCDRHAEAVIRLREARGEVFLGRPR